jgi:hypothetical protein
MGALEATDDPLREPGAYWMSMPRAPVLLAAPVCLAACQLIGGIGDIDQAGEGGIGDGGGADQTEAATTDARGDARADAGVCAGDASLLDGASGGGLLCPSMQSLTMTCSPGEFCCVEMQGTMPSGVCDSNGATCEGGVPVLCADKADCPSGEFCCGLQEVATNPPQYLYVGCKPACDPNTVNGTRLLQLCAPDSGECVAPTPVCTPSILLGGFYVCNP